MAAHATSARLFLYIAWNKVREREERNGQCGRLDKCNFRTVCARAAVTEKLFRAGEELSASPMRMAGLTFVTTRTVYLAKYRYVKKVEG